MRRPRLLKLLGLSLSVLLALALAAELGLRVFAASRGIDAQAALELAHPEGGLYVPHPYTGYTLRHVPGAPDRNKDGLRGPEVERHKAPGVVRILCLGGSTTYGSGLTADEAYPARLGALLAPFAAAGTDGGSGRRYEVLNCGVPGYSTAESLIDLELRLLEFEPDALVIYHGVNDARLVQARGFEPDYSHMRVAWREPRLSALSQWLWTHSYAYAWLARAGGFGPKSIRLEDLIYVEGYEGLYVPAAGGEDGAGAEGAMEVNRDGVAAFLRNIGSMVAVARARGIEVLLTTFPMRGGAGARVEGQDFAPTVGVMNRQLVEYARAQGVPLCDFAAALDGRRELFQDQAHLNAEGAQVQAELVLQAAREAGQWGLGR